MKTSLFFLLLSLALTACAPKDFQTPGSISLNSPDAFAIVGGQKVKDEAFSRSIVGVYNHYDGDICTGTLIAKDVVLTAAHCLRRSAPSFTVIFDKEHSAQNRESRVLSVHVHPEYGGIYNNNVNDIGLLKLASLPPKEFKPMNLPSPEVLAKMGRSVTVAGYGGITGDESVKDRQNGFLRFVDVMMMQKGLNTSMKVFTVDQTQGKGICHGDSGGPAIATVNGTFYVVGVTSMFTPDYTSHVPSKGNFDICRTVSLFSSVQAYLPWILKTTAGLTGK